MIKIIFKFSVIAFFISFTSTISADDQTTNKIRIQTVSMLMSM